MVLSREPSTTAEAVAQMLTWLNGDLLVQALYAAAALGLADLVADGAMHADELAATIKWCEFSRIISSQGMLISLNEAGIKCTMRM